MTTPVLTEPRAGDARAWLPAYATLALLWGASFLFIKVAVEGGVAPIYLTLGRCAAGALVLVVLLAVTRDRLPRDPRLWGHLALLAFIGNVVPFTLFGYGEQRVSSILAGIWNGTTPLMVLLVVLLFMPSERPTRERILGLVVGFVGVLVVLGVWRDVGGGELTGQLMCFGAAACYGFAIPYTKKIMNGRSESGLALAGGQLVAATAQLLVIAPLLAGAPPTGSTLTPKVIASVVALGALGTGVAFALNFRVIRLAGTTTASTVTYVVPLIATVIGIVVLAEHLSWYEPVGALIVLAGVALSQRAPARRA
ncbi:DMT family transporter [Luedemannella helvata]|uniref:DMT family transporter n=1 Tax=Luedemannella helvata TaxID=349315 RepID=A0ABN2K5N0_9ACTN